MTRKWFANMEKHLASINVTKCLISFWKREWKIVEESVGWDGIAGNCTEQGSAMKCFPHLSLLCSQLPTPSHFGSIVCYIARDFIDRISHCSNLALSVLYCVHVLTYWIDSELLKGTLQNCAEIVMISAWLTSQRGSLWHCWYLLGIAAASVTTHYTLLSY